MFIELTYSYECIDDKLAELMACELVKNLKEKSVKYSFTFITVLFYYDLGTKPPGCRTSISLNKNPAMHASWLKTIIGIFLH